VFGNVIYLYFVCLLSVVSKAIIDGHEGKLEVFSEGVGISGSVFSLVIPVTIEIPRDPDDAVEFGAHESVALTIHDEENDESLDEEVERDESGILELAENNSSQKHLIQAPYGRALIVDDVTSTRKMMVRALASSFEEIVQASDGQEAVDMVKDSFEKVKPFDIIFMDSVMPNMGGIEACRIIRSLGYDGMVVAITGNILPEDVMEFTMAGANKLIGKPVKLDQLMDILKEV
jgi:CheY-like chemotaxis protein